MSPVGNQRSIRSGTLSLSLRPAALQSIIVRRLGWLMARTTAAAWATVLSMSVSCGDSGSMQ